MKAKGAEIKDFYYNYWPEKLDNYYYDSDNVEIEIEDDNGNWILEDKLSYDLNGFGWVMDNDDKTDGLSFQSAFSKYKKTKNNLIASVSVPMEDIGRFYEMMKDNNWKIL